MVEDNHRIEWGDTIRNPLLKEKDGNGLLHFDVVTANPHFRLINGGMMMPATTPMGALDVAFHQKPKATMRLSVT